MLLEQETSIRLIVFFSGLIGFWAVGIYFPYRKTNTRERSRRWFNNLFFLVLNTLAIRLLVPLSLTTLALTGTEKSLGLLHLFHLPGTANFILALLLLDLGIYWQHRLMHGLPTLWRIHRLHHSDIELDVTTAGRFHTLEILISYGIKGVMILAIGAPATAVILFEVILNFCAMLTHANVGLPKPIEGPVRLFVVTPDMHRIHHSSKPGETNSNYGFCLSVWDRIFDSHTQNPREDARAMEIGLKEFRATDEQGLKSLLLQPFK